MAMFFLILLFALISVFVVYKCINSHSTLDFMNKISNSVQFL